MKALSNKSKGLLMTAQVFRLSFGPKSFVVVSDAAVARHIMLTNAANYSKGILSEILDFVMGSGGSLPLPSSLPLLLQQKSTSTGSKDS